MQVRARQKQVNRWSQHGFHLPSSALGAGLMNEWAVNELLTLKFHRHAHAATHTE